MGRDTIQLEGAVSTISGEYLLEFTSDYGIPENLHPEVPGLGETIVDFLEGKVGVYTRLFEFANYRIPLSQFLFDILRHYQIHISQLSVIGDAKVSNFEINCRVHNIIPTLNLFRIDERIFPTAVDWHASAPRDEMPIAGSYSAADVTLLNTDRAPFPKITRKPIMPSRVKTELLPWGRRVSHVPVNTGTRPRAAHEVPLLTATANRVIDLKDPTVASGSSGTPSTVERSPLDFDNEDHAPSLAEGAGAEEHVQEGLTHEIPPVETATTTEVVQEAVHEEEVDATEPPVNKRRKQMRYKRVNEEAEANAPPKVLRKDHASGPHIVHAEENPLLQ
ncbi:hypothetical protein Tco_0755752 [Tanacetum coccineum]